MSAHTLFGRVGKVFRTCAKSHCLKLFTKSCSNQITLNYIVWIGCTKDVTDTPPPPPSIFHDCVTNLNMVKMACMVHELLNER